MKEKSPYGKFTLEQVERAEATSFVIQVGEEFFNEDDIYYAFPKEKAEHYLEVAKEGLYIMMKEGSEQERQAAFRSLCDIRILPLRIQ